MTPTDERMNTHELAHYSAMCHAIALCHSIDEVKDLKNKARALEIYAAQSQNLDAERKACEVRLRAERRTGELLGELVRATPQTARQIVSNGATRSPYAEALDRTGISRQTAHRYQALADVPAATFEAALRDPEKPTTTGLLAKAEAARAVQAAKDSAPQMPSDSLWLWGRARDLERDGYFTKDAGALLSPMTDSMLADMRRLLPLMAAFINELTEAIHESA